MYVLYNGEGELWHQRRRVASSRVSWATNYILTPDGDCYPEKYDLQEDSISAVRYAEARWPPPPGLARGNVYRFRGVPSQQELDDATDQTEAQERGEHRAREIAAGRDPAVVPAGGYIERLPVAAAAAAAPALAVVPAAMAAPAAAVAGAAAAAGAPRRVGAPVGGGGAGGVAGGGAAGAGDQMLVWAVVETSQQYRRGTEVALPAGASVVGSCAVVLQADGTALCLRQLKRCDLRGWVGAEAAGDARILNVELSDAGRIRSQWRGVVGKSSVTDFADWPVVGPRTAE